MREISAVITVFNEAELLPYILANVASHVDEIIAIDGGPEGSSTDGTLEILESADKVVYKTCEDGDNYRKSSNGSWDMARQRNDGINLATGDIYLFLSADMLFLRLECLREAAEDDSKKIFFCDTLEFWEDTSKLRLYTADADVLTLPGQMRQAIAVDRCYHPFWEDGGTLNLDGAELKDRAILAGTIKFHMGWIRPFREQVEKHIRNMKQGRRPEVGIEISNDERKMQQWAIREAMSYESIPSIGYSGELPEEMEELKDMNYGIGKAAVLKDYEDQYGMSPFRG